MKLLNKKHSVTLVLENCESINVDVEFEKLDVTRVEMIFDDCYEFNYVENAKFKIARDDLIC